MIRGNLVKLATGLVLGSLAVAVPTPAMAAPVVVPDPDDARGLLDLEEVRKSGSDPLFRMVTFSDWSVSDIWSSGTLMAEFDTLGGERTDYYALITPTHKRLKGVLFRDRSKKDDYKVKSFKVWRKDRRSVSFRISLEWMAFGASRDHYGWRTQTLWNGSKNCSEVCFDLAPNAGALIVEPLAPK